MHGTHPLIRLVLLLALGLSGAAVAESERAAARDAVGKPGATESAAAPVVQASLEAPAHIDQAQIDAWLAAARVLTAERPDPFSGAEGVLASPVLPGGQGVAANIALETLLTAYADAPLDSAQWSVFLAGDAPPEETVTPGPLDLELVPNSRLDRPEARSPARTDGNARRASTMTAAVGPPHVGATYLPPTSSNRVTQGVRPC